MHLNYRNLAGCCASAEVRERDKETEGPSWRSGFDPGLRSSFFLIETLAITGQKFCVFKMAATVYDRDHCFVYQHPSTASSSSSSSSLLFKEHQVKASLEQNYNINHAAEGQYEQIINDNVIISAPYHDRQGKRTAGRGFVSIYKP